MEYDIEKIVSNMDFKSLELVNLNNGLSLTNNEIMILDRYGIDYKQCSSLKEVLSLIEEVFTYGEVDDFEELDGVSQTIAERDYYQNTNK
ncbi:MAG: hypothetical protein MSS28_03200 [Tenericutes bacterium]|nr:hypothetical protein [Mycoplasmatota bacterium]